MGRVVSLLLALALALLPAAGAQAETITWWHWNTPEMMALYQPLIEEFEAETGIRVELQQVGWEEMQDRLTVALAGGVAPDVAMVSSRWGDAAASRGTFEFITRFVEDDPEIADFFPPAMKLWQTWSGEQYGIPIDMDVPALFYNKEMFDVHGLAYPTDIGWDEWYEITRIFTRDRDGDGEFDQYGLTDWWNVWLTLVWANGGELVNAERTGVALDTDEARRAIEYYKRYIDARLLPASEDAERLGFAHQGALWKGGKVAMAVAGPWMPNNWIWDQEIGDYTFDFDVAHMPRAYGGGRATSIEGVAFAIPKGAKADAAWKFIRHITSAEAMTAYGLEGFPARISVAREALDIPGRKPESSMAFVEAVAYARPFPQGVGWWDGVYVAITEELEGYLTGEAGFTGALENIARRIAPILEKARDAAA